MSNTDRGLRLARHYLDVDRPERALELLERLEDVDLEDPAPWLLRGRALYGLGRFDDAARAAGEGLARDPELPPLLYLRCDCEERRGDLAAAERAILECLRLDPENPYALCRYALLVARAGQVDKAARLVDEASRIDPEHEGVRRCRMIVAYLQGRDEEAAQHGRGLLTANPDDAFVHHMLGHAMFQQGQVGDGSRHLVHAARLEPDDSDLVDAAREARVASHWLLLPLWPIQRYGQVTLWLLASAAILGLYLAGSPLAALAFSLGYLTYCVYTWIMPPLVTRWTRWRSR